MLKRADFIFTVGYEGNTAIIDASAKRKYGKLNTHELAERGLFKEAICSALYIDSNEELEEVMRLYNEQNEKKIDSVATLKRIFGVTHVPEEIEKILLI
jgi:hypothetical protein